MILLLLLLLLLLYRIMFIDEFKQIKKKDMDI